MVRSLPGFTTSCSVHPTTSHTRRMSVSIVIPRASRRRRRSMRSLASFSTRSTNAPFPSSRSSDFRMACWRRSASQAAGVGGIVSGLAKQALKLVGSEALKSGVEYFKDLFNNDKNIAKRYGKPELKGGEIRDNVRTWIISPAGNLSKNDIKE